jgi:hypothetical protein
MVISIHPERQKTSRSSAFLNEKTVFQADITYKLRFSIKDSRFKRNPDGYLTSYFFIRKNEITRAIPPKRKIIEK